MRQYAIAITPITIPIMNHLKKFNESSDENESQLSYIENKIIEILNEADEKLNKEEFEQLSESISDYIDEIARSKHD